MRSPSMTIARMTAKTGVMLLSAPAMFGPIRRLDSKFSSATVPGKNNPTNANKTIALHIAFAWVHIKRSKAPKEQRRGWNADRGAQSGHHPPQPELGEHETGAQPEHRREGEENCGGNGCHPG